MAFGYDRRNLHEHGCAELGIGRGTINHRKTSVRLRYYDIYGALRYNL